VSVTNGPNRAPCSPYRTPAPMPRVALPEARIVMHPMPWRAPVLTIAWLLWAAFALLLLTLGLATGHVKLALCGVDGGTVALVVRSLLWLRSGSAGPISGGRGARGDVRRGVPPGLR
jgi:hypothetical protein